MRRQKSRRDVPVQKFVGDVRSPVRNGFAFALTLRSSDQFLPMDIPEHFHFCHRRLVDFADTDLSGLVHFANFLRYVENAEHAFFRSLGFRVHTSEGPEHEGWPRLEVSCRYYKPARFEENLEICLRVEEMRTSSLRYAFWIFGEKLAAPGVVAAGTCVTIHVGLDTVGRTIGKTPIPADLRRSLETVMTSAGVRPALRTGNR